MKQTILRLLSILLASSASIHSAEIWHLESSADWQKASAGSEGVAIADGLVSPTGTTGVYRSHPQTFPEKVAAKSITLEQSPLWLNWQPVDKVLPPDLGDAPVFLSIGPGNYWAFGLKRGGPGGYHAWQSKDMESWQHHGMVTPRKAKWTTTAEYVDGRFYIYYDFPNDQDPHVFVDENLFDGTPGRDMGMAFPDPSDGSDCAIIRDLNGKFHLIYEDWSPIDASKHSWDSPLAGHAVSEDGLSDFKILPPVVDKRTKPTGIFKEFAHPHWHKDDPENYPAKPGYNRAFARYEVHEPEQDAFGDWAAISIGGQYYLFGDYHPAGKNRRHDMSVAWFTSADINTRFTFCGNIGSGHPDPDIGFAEGKFYLLTQTKHDFISPGPWVERVELRMGVDTKGDGTIDHWSAWQEVKESYDHIPGFAKQIAREPGTIDLSQLPSGYGFAFELQISDTTENNSKPLLDKITLEFE